MLEADWLRALLWLVALLTLAGNASVLAFTACTRGTTAAPLTVGKFLVANLAVADLALVSHLVALGGQDAATRGEYFNHAQRWQQGGWCDAMGFLAVFGAELSVFTLCAITLERWYAISHAINLTKRMRMRHAVVIMAAGWALCSAIAAAPLFDVSSYRVTSMCMPFRYDTLMDKAYILFLLVVNVGAFLLVLCCYVSMFLQVRGSDARSSGDAYIAKRMALLVFTDFICWGPVAIVAALSAGGIDVSLSSFSLSQLTHAKIVLAVFYPFNACANPFLYALLTKQFRKDVVTSMGRFGLCRWKLRSVVESLTTSHSSSPWHLTGSRGSRRGRGTMTQPSAGSLTTQAGAPAYPHQPCGHGSAAGRPRTGTADEASLETPGPDSNNRSADWFIPPHVCGAREPAASQAHCPRHQLFTGDCCCCCLQQQQQQFPPPASVTRTQASGQQQHQHQHPLLEARLSTGRGRMEQHPLLELRLSSSGRSQTPCCSAASLACHVSSADAAAAAATAAAAAGRDSLRRAADCLPSAETGQPKKPSAAAAAAVTLSTRDIAQEPALPSGSREPRAASGAVNRSMDETEPWPNSVSTASDGGCGRGQTASDGGRVRTSLLLPASKREERELDQHRQPWARPSAVAAGACGAEAAACSYAAGQPLSSTASGAAALSRGAMAEASGEPDEPVAAERKLSAGGQGRSNRESGFYSLERPTPSENSPFLGRTCEDPSIASRQPSCSSSVSATCGVSSSGE